MLDKHESKNVDYVELLWIDISKAGKTTQFILCCLFVFIFHLTYGYLQEYIFALDGFKPHGWYLTLVQFFFYPLFGWLENMLRKNIRKIPLKSYCILAALTVGTMGFSNSSLQYLNYSTQVIFKCCKLIPVMIGGILIQKKAYKLIDYVASICMCIGLILFTLADSKISPNFDILGVIMISCALVCDAGIGNVQEQQMKKYHAYNHEVIFYSYFIGFFYLLVILTLTGEFLKGFIFFYESPSVYWYAFLFSLSGYLGIQVVLTLIRSCGALTAVTVTTFRKAISIVISFIFFEKPFTLNYVWAGLLILLGIYLNVMSKNQISYAKILAWFFQRKEKAVVDIV